MAPRRSSYTVREKARAVLIAEEHGNRAAGREVGVSEKLIRDWRKAKAAGAWQTIVKGKRKLGCGRRAFHPALEAELTEWLRLRRSTGITVSTDDIRRKAKVLGQMARFAVEDSVKFSPNWRSPCHEGEDDSGAEVTRGLDCQGARIPALRDQL